MALSKLAILLIAGIGSVAAVGGITAGVVVSRQNSAQTINSSNDEFNEPSSTNNKENKNNPLVLSDKTKRDSNPSDLMISDESNANDQNDGLDQAKEKQKLESEKNSSQLAAAPKNTETDMVKNVGSTKDSKAETEEPQQKAEESEAANDSGENGKQGQEDDGKELPVADPAETGVKNGMDQVVDEHLNVGTEQTGK